MTRPVASKATVTPQRPRAEWLPTDGETRLEGVCRCCRRTVVLYRDLAGRLRLEGHEAHSGPCRGKDMTPEGVEDPYKVGPMWGYLTTALGPVRGPRTARPARRAP